MQLGKFFDPKISVGNLLTMLSVIVAAGTLYYQLKKDDYLERHKQANEIRSSTAKTLASIEQWRNISLEIFNLSKPLFVETSRLVKPDSDKRDARDYLFESLENEHSKVQQKLSDEKIGTVYVDLYQTPPFVRDYFLSIASDLRNSEGRMFRELQDATQNAIANSGANEDPARLGNELRKRNAEVKENYIENSTNILKPAERFLSELVHKSDSDLLNQDN